MMKIINLITIINNPSSTTISPFELSSFIIGLLAFIISIYLFWLEFQIKPSIDRIEVSATKKENEFLIRMYVANDGKGDIRRCKCWVSTDSGSVDLFFVELEHPNRSSEHTTKYFSLPAKREISVRGYITTSDQRITVYFLADKRLVNKNHSWR